MALPRSAGDRTRYTVGLVIRLGVDRSYVAKLENGHRSPLLDLIFEVLAELEATVEVSERHGDRGRG